MQSNEIRTRFLKFFEKQGHKILNGSSLIPDNPTMLLTTAGMVQFVPYFKGELKPENTRMATVQRCIRTTDIDNIGHTARHLSFFEMLGNFSVGDYFKKDAIPWAWEFITDEMKIDPDKLWISVFTDDDEAAGIWEHDVGVEPGRIIRLGESENFWSMGDVGPCGPCSEMLYDFGEHMRCGPDCEPGCDCDRFLEIWNLVFMQYNKKADGSLEPLPKKNIDTGMGLERISAVLQDAETAFDTDLLKPIVAAVADVTGVPYGKDKAKDISIKIVADHARAITFLTGDGVLPSNEGRGYIARRLARRAVRHGRTLGAKGPFLQGLADAVIDMMGEAYEDVSKNRVYIKEIIGAEEARFDATLKQGLSVLDEFIDGLAGKRKAAIPSELAFKLYDTYGFPFELTKEIAEENGMFVDEAKFNELTEEQRMIAKKGSSSVFVHTDKETYAGILSETGETEFTGYADETAESRVVAIIKDGSVVDEAGAGDGVELILKETPFYAEMGGQVGDTGSIKSKAGQVSVNDTITPLKGLTVHKGTVSEGTIKKGDKVKASIDIEKRAAIRRNHTGTHLLHWALRRVLGDHVRQGGSLVGPSRLRFDFTHGKALTLDETGRIERMANKQILANHQVRSYTTTYKYATESGAIAFFGEKYGKYVKVLEIDDFSRELCAGTHVSRTGDIGQLKIVSEASVGANLRRIEAVTGMNAYERADKQDSLLKDMEKALKATRADMISHVKNMQSTIKEQERDIEALKARFGNIEVDRILSGAEDAGGTRLIVVNVRDKDMNELRVMADEIRNRARPSATVLGSSKNGAASLLIALTEDIAGEKVSADKVIREVASLIKGGGGGRPDLAQAGGKDVTGLDSAVEKAGGIIRGLLA